MKTGKLVALVVALGAVAPCALVAQTAADSTAIRNAALDYLEGWERSDAERMARALHEDVVKRGIMGGINEMGKAQLVGMTSNKRSANPDFDGSDHVHLLDIFQDIATVRVDFPGWVDHVQIAKLNGEWSIVNVLWQPRR